MQSMKRKTKTFFILFLSLVQAVSPHVVSFDDLPLGDDLLPQEYLQNELKYIILYYFILSINAITIIVKNYLSNAINNYWYDIFCQKCYCALSSLLCPFLMIQKRVQYLLRVIHSRLLHPFYPTFPKMNKQMYCLKTIKPANT